MNEDFTVEVLSEMARENWKKQIENSKWVECLCSKKLNLPIVEKAIDDAVDFGDKLCNEFVEISDKLNEFGYEVFPRLGKNIEFVEIYKK